MPGILERLGSWGTSIIKSAIETGRGIAETVGILKPTAPEITIPEASTDWGHVSRSEESRPDVLALRNDEQVPDHLYEHSEIPWSRKFAYTVSVYGRDIATGRFARQDYDLTASRKLTIGEVKGMAASRIGQDGTSALINIFSMTVSNAWEREE